jgi:hypothetical protein
VQPEQGTDLVQRRDRVAQQLDQPGQQQVAHRVPGQRAGAAEAVLHQRPPGAARLVVGGQRVHRHPQVPGG